MKIIIINEWNNNINKNNEINKNTVSVTTEKLL